MPVVHLRPIELHDLDSIMSWVNDPAVVGNFAGLSRTITHDDEREYLEKIIASDKDKLYVIETAERNYIGNIGLHEIDRSNNSARYGMIIGKKNYWGRGYAQSAINSLLELAFQEHQLQQVWAKFLATNEKMRHINVDKCGFRVDSIMPREYFRDGKYHDMIRVSMTADDYRMKSTKNI